MDTNDAEVLKSSAETGNPCKCMKKEEMEYRRCCKLLGKVKHADVVCATQEWRAGIGLRNFWTFRKSTVKGMKEAMFYEVEKGEEIRTIRLVQCSQRGHFLKWLEYVVSNRIVWMEVWAWQQERLSSVIKSIFDVLHSSANLVQWNIQTTFKSRCVGKATERHILSSCRLGLDIYTGRHNQIVRVVSPAVKDELHRYIIGDNKQKWKSAENTLQEGEKRKLDQVI